MPRGVFKRKVSARAAGVAAGGCAQCGGSRDGGSQTLCVVCLQKQRDRAARLKSQGLCTHCTMPTEGTGRCRACLDKVASRVQRILRSGICGACRAAPLIPDRKVCEDCYLKRTCDMVVGDRTRWQELRALFDLQDGICALTGAKMVLGLGTSIDHRIPVSRGGTHDISNLQWTTWVANKAKNNLTHEEFVAMCRAIAAFA